MDLSNEANDGPLLVTLLDHQHGKVREALKLSAYFVVHSLATPLERALGLSGADVFTIKDLLGHSSVAVPQKYVRPSSESKERAIERMMAEYPHIIIGDVTVDEGMDKNEITEARGSHKSPHSTKTAPSGNPAKLLQ